MPANSLRLHDYLPYRLSVASNAVSRLIARAYEDKFGLSIAEWRLLAILGDEGPLTQQALCGRTLMDKVTVLRAARTLLRRRLIRRLPNPADGRSHRLSMTVSGRSLYQEIVPLAKRHEKQLLEGIGEADVRRLHQLLRQLQETAGANGDR
jgi:DNA-binding MarR family transcriptional regulator